MSETTLTMSVVNPKQDKNKNYSKNIKDLGTPKEINIKEIDQRNTNPIKSSKYCSISNKSIKKSFTEKEDNNSISDDSYEIKDLNSKNNSLYDIGRTDNKTKPNQNNEMIKEDMIFNTEDKKVKIVEPLDKKTKEGSISSTTISGYYSEQIRNLKIFYYT